MSSETLPAMRAAITLTLVALVSQPILGCSTEPSIASAATNRPNGTVTFNTTPIASSSAQPTPSNASPASASSSTGSSSNGSSSNGSSNGTTDANAPMVTLSAVGDCTLGDPAGSERAPGSFHQVFEDHQSDFARPFSGVVATLSEDDLTIANLETTLGTHPQRTDLPFAFRGKPEFAKMLGLGSVELVNLANNHSNDCGPKGVVETMASLDAVHMPYYGLRHIDQRIIHGIEVVNLGYTGGRFEVHEEVEKDIKAHKRPDNLVIVTFHWGIEGEHATNTVQIHLGHASIDAGADLVIGHHPHVLQGIEEYKGKKIVYSLGNFVFGGNAKPAELDSMIYRARFVMRDGKVEPLDDRIIPVAVSGNRVQNDFQPVLLTGADADRVAKNVADYSEALKRNH